MANKKKKTKQRAVLPALPQQYKPLDYLRRKPVITELVEHGMGHLTDQSGNHDVLIQWKMNDMATRDKIFKLQIEDKVVYLDLEELMFYARMIGVK